MENPRYHRDWVVAVGTALADPERAIKTYWLMHDVMKQHFERDPEIIGGSSLLDVYEAFVKAGLIAGEQSASQSLL